MSLIETQMAAPTAFNLHEAALAYHRARDSDDIGGKIEIHVTKPVGSQDDLSLAYSPGVA
ncbi:MAG: hypothetical protein RJB68_994, partial [Pseudomonadota bacterium]